MTMKMFFRYFLQRNELVDAGIVHQYIQVTESLLRLAE